MAVTNLLGDHHRQRAPVLALHVDDTLVGFRGGQRLDREAHLSMLGLGHCHRYFVRIVHLFLLTCAGKTRRRPVRARTFCWHGLSQYLAQAGTGKTKW